MANVDNKVKVIISKNKSEISDLRRRGVVKVEGIIKNLVVAKQEFPKDITHRACINTKFGETKIWLKGNELEYTTVISLA